MVLLSETHFTCGVESACPDGLSVIKATVDFRQARHIISLHGMHAPGCLEHRWRNVIVKEMTTSEKLANHSKASSKPMQGSTDDQLNARMTRRLLLSLH